MTALSPSWSWGSVAAGRRDAVDALAPSGGSTSARSCSTLPASSRRPFLPTAHAAEEVLAVRRRQRVPPQVDGVQHRRQRHLRPAPVWANVASKSDSWIWRWASARTRARGDASGSPAAAVGSSPPAPLPPLLREWDDGASSSSSACNVTSRRTSTKSTFSAAHARHPSPSRVGGAH